MKQGSGGIDIRRTGGRVLLALVLLAPLPFGAVQGWAVGLLQMALLALFIALLLHGLLTGRSLRLPLFAAAASFIALHLGQIIPLPGPVLEKISPFSHYIFQALWPESARGLRQTVSVSPQATLSSLLWFSGCLAAFYCAVMICRRGRQTAGGLAPGAVLLNIPAGNRPEKVALILSITLAAAGTFQAAYGLAEHLLGWNRIFFYVRRFPMEGVAGTFINANNCAAFLALCLPLTLSLVLYLRQVEHPRPGNSKKRRKSSNTSSSRYPGLVLLFSTAAALIALALVLTRSGGGIISSSAGLILFCLYYLYRRPGAKPLMPYLIILAVALLCFAAIGLFIAPDFTMTTLVKESTGNASGRLTVWRESLAVSTDFPLLGSGAGTYGQLMLHYCNRMVVHAHNEYVELFCDHGPLGLLLALLLVSFLGRLVFSLLFRRSRERFGQRPGSLPPAHYLPLGISVALFSLTVHSIVDFPLRIPAIALAGASLLGVLTAMQARQSRGRAARRRTGSVLLILACTALLGFSGFRLFHEVRHGAGFERLHETARGEIELLAQGDPGTAVPSAATDLTVRSCILARPLDLRGHRLGFELARLQGNRSGMERALVRSTLARPVLSRTHYDLGQFLLGQGRFRESLAAFKCSLELDNEYLDEIYGSCEQMFVQRFELFEFIFPWKPTLRERLGELLQMSGLAEESLEQFQWCVSQRPDRALLHAKIAAIQLRNHELEPALAAIDEALRLEPGGKEQYYLTRAEVLLRMGELERAIEACEALLSANPGYEEGYVLLARCFQENGEDWRAISAYRAALWRVVRRSRIHRLLGDQYVRLDKQHQALEEYQAGLREASTDHERKLVLYRMGLCYEELDRLEDALGVMTEAAALPAGESQSLDQRVSRSILRIGGKIPAPES